MEGLPNEEKLISELKSKLDPFRFSRDDEINDFADSLKKKYGERDVYKYALFHILGGSTGYEDLVEHFDFPGEDSVERFIRSL